MLTHPVSCVEFALVPDGRCFERATRCDTHIRTTDRIPTVSPFASAHRTASCEAARRQRLTNCLVKSKVLISGSQWRTVLETGGYSAARPTTSFADHDHDHHQRKLNGFSEHLRQHDSALMYCAYASACWRIMRGAWEETSYCIKWQLTAMPSAPDRDRHSFFDCTRGRSILVYLPNHIQVI